LAALQRERETSVQPLKKPTANKNTYSRAGTAELKPYSRTAKKILQKKSNIYYFSYIFHLYCEEMALVIGQQRSILKIQKLRTTLF
jgi:hypothetical protein